MIVISEPPVGVPSFSSWRWRSAAARKSAPDGALSVRGGALAICEVSSEEVGTGGIEAADVGASAGDGCCVFDKAIMV